MIFITLGSQKFQFNRLLKAIDNLIDDGIIREKVFAQVGYSDYIPKNYEFKNFLDREEFKKVMSNSDKVITHGGTGAIVGALKENKMVIAVPRLKEFGEHVDNHQLEITKLFKEMNYIAVVLECDKLGEIIEKIDDIVFSKYKSNTENIIKSIKKFIDKI
ncbi:PssE/Cps14G family polysaccharide biosynthesis glycosyltransferase [Clostridium baratii]|uniref:PssE/Cps14G family polysaccharide biosynthesis glycosyltransferase n=1 Tax=Clostridium baratii TaxID=1561 RepID=UPI001C22D32F|nr:PssE/Cps14G family polysaccharide biosynthesis glycosyltransferase [Clostridium baratii]